MTSTFNDNLEILSKLGDGLTSIVYLAQYLSSDKQVAIKVFKPSYALNQGEMILNEIEIQKKIDHPNFIKIFDNGQDGVLVRPNGRIIKGLSYVIMEVATEGTLLNVCQDLGKLSENQVRFFFTQILCILIQLKQNGITHGDLKLENFLLDSQMNLKLTDFGFSSSKIENLTSYNGTKSYTAPEIFNEIPYNGHKSDIFSCGVILHVLATGNFPFIEAKKENILYQHIQKDQLDVFWSINDPEQKLSPDFRALVQSMIAYDVNVRLSVDEIHNQNFLQTPFKFEQERQKIIDQKHTEETHDSSGDEN